MTGAAARIAAAIAALGILIAPVASQARPTLSWQVEEDTNHGLRYGSPPTGRDDRDPGLYCSGETLHVYFYLNAAHFRTRVARGDFVDAHGRFGPWSQSFQVSAGGLRAVMIGDVRIDRLPMASVTIPLDSPLYAAFARTGRIQLSTLGQSSRFARLPPAMLAQVVRWCATGDD